jgi:hypothetical protein
VRRFRLSECALDRRTNKRANKCGEQREFEKTGPPQVAKFEAGRTWAT